MASRTLFRTLSWTAWDPGLPAQLFNGTTPLGSSIGRASGWSDNGTETLIGCIVSSAQLLHAPQTERCGGHGVHALHALHALRGFHQGV